MATKLIALVTGANKGIGFEIVRQLAGQGVQVLLGARDQTRGQEAAQKLQEQGLDICFVPLDVTDEASIRAAASTIERDFGRLDILVNNAGVALEAAPASQADLNVMRRTFETNVFGVIALTQALLPLLHKAQAARIVNVSSSLGSLTLSSDPAWDFYNVTPLAYNASKTALNALTVLLAKELRDSNIKVNSACPGHVDTDLSQHQGPRTVEQGAGEPVRLALLPEEGPTGGFFDENGQVPW